MIEQMAMRVLAQRVTRGGRDPARGSWRSIGENQDSAKNDFI